MSELHMLADQLLAILVEFEDFICKRFGGIEIEPIKRNIGIFLFGRNEKTGKVQLLLQSRDGELPKPWSEQSLKVKLAIEVADLTKIYDVLLLKEGQLEKGSAKKIMELKKFVNCIKTMHEKEKEKEKDE